ncbi:hypothetical protein OGM63_22005 [Plectonema radiosum NIES-515]|uniref:Uncharacterized protein n=1 Tax=Plectonema radiosum NIES-515 TaxID=2986073 RepID=A0ABT3B452_9CYAN|nr:hypothetical protein [Plectonema radiosum]MCV3216151.1 hypothetical protein [Plectonema radiosum NIES-515]
MKIFVTACALLALTIPTFVAPRQAVADESRENSCQSVVGTYLARSSSPSDPTSVSSELITFNGDGNFTATGSNSGGDPDATSFANQTFGPTHGSWKCTRNREIIARGFNFNYRTRNGFPPSISISTYRLRFNSRTQTVAGEASFDVYDLNSTPQNPVRLPDIGGPFQSNYVGNRITPE